MVAQIFLEELCDLMNTTIRKAHRNLIAEPVGFFGKKVGFEMNEEFTLPMLVIRDYVLGP